MASKGQTTGEEQLLTQKPMGFVEETDGKRYKYIVVTCLENI